MGAWAWLHKVDSALWWGVGAGAWLDKVDKYTCDRGSRTL